MFLISGYCGIQFIPCVSFFKSMCFDATSWGIGKVPPFLCCLHGLASYIRSCAKRDELLLWPETPCIVRFSGVVSHLIIKIYRPKKLCQQKKVGRGS